jgi:hypothetical protein
LTAGSFSNFDSAADVEGDGVGVDGGADVAGATDVDGTVGAGVDDGAELDESDGPDELQPARTVAATMRAPTHA